LLTQPSLGQTQVRVPHIKYDMSGNLNIANDQQQQKQSYDNILKVCKEDLEKNGILTPHHHYKIKANGTLMSQFNESVSDSH
jgi:hypothetical protein